MVEFLYTLYMEAGVSIFPGRIKKKSKRKGSVCVCIWVYEGWYIYVYGVKGPPKKMWR